MDFPTQIWGSGASQSPQELRGGQLHARPLHLMGPSREAPRWGTAQPSPGEQHPGHRCRDPDETPGVRGLTSKL